MFTTDKIISSAVDEERYCLFLAALPVTTTPWLLKELMRTEEEAVTL